ncbi:MAG TPA: hypothetical protein VFA29_04620 [Candidatus Baltobacteraceae bacterium]|nr:hypothetical protein [Candidatus Baltobacteraceae bacterium]
MQSFKFEAAVPVVPPYRLDLTADALRRLAANVVDVVDGGAYRRVLADERGSNLVEVTQPREDALRVRIDGAGAARWLPVVERMLGVHAPLGGWFERTAPFPWLAYLARELAGLHPPQYPSLFESLAHAIVFQQISIHAAASIMRRFVERLSVPVSANGAALYPFPSPESVLAASDEALRAAGLSANKTAHLRSAAEATLNKAVTREEIDALPTARAAERLCEIRGIGPWSAAVVMLRGFGRMDVFPLKDSGVARSLSALSGDPSIDAHALLEALGPLRGMLYFHLLLGRMRNLTGTAPTSGVS